MRNAHLVLVSIVSLLPFALAQAAPANLPETGQAICTDSVGTVVICTGTGQDGDTKAGVEWPIPRFSVGTGVGTTDACVTDNLTGLMWVRAPSATAVAWSTALVDVDALTLCGFSDWRLPNVNELKSLVNLGASSPAVFLNAQGFTGVQYANYWSSSSYASDVTFAWFVAMSNGTVAGDHKALSYYVWPVRAGR